MESLILEKQPSALGAYSTRILRRNYQRAIMRVRRTVDSAHADVRADANGVISLDSRISIASGTSSATTLGEFVANASYTDVDSLGSPSIATVAVWYDQSGSNNHMTQVVTGSQPRIIGNTGAVYQGDNGPTVYLNSDHMDSMELVGDFTVYLSFRLLSPFVELKLFDGTNELIDISTPANGITLSQITDSDTHLNGYSKGDSSSIDFDSRSDNTLTVSGTFASTGITKIGAGQGSLSDFYIYPRAKKGKRRRDVEVVTTREKQAPLSYSNRGDIDTTAFLNKFDGVANAFSLRSLNKEDSNPLVSVRREVDHKEVFVFPDTSGFVSLSSTVSECFKKTTGIAAGPHLSVPPSKATTLGQFLGDSGSSDPDSLGASTTGRVVMMFDQASANETLRRRLLDYHTGSEAAYSTKRLSTSYTGPCFEVSIFSSTSPYALISTSDIEFDSAGSISKTFSTFRSQALQTHGASTIIRASKIYDQSGNGRHLVQSSRDEMPEILLNTVNGEVGFSFGGTDGSYRQSMSVSSLSIPTPFSYSTTFFRALGNVDGYKYIDFGGNVSIQSGATNELSVSDGLNSIEPSGFMPQNVVNHIYGAHDGASSEFGYNGAVTSGSGLTSSITSIQVNESGQSSDIDTMYFHELIVWGENKSTGQGQKEDIDSYSDLVYRTEDSNAKAFPSTAQPKIYDATNGLVQDGGSVSLEVVQDNYFLFDKSKMAGKPNVSSFVSLSTSDSRGYLYAVNGTYYGPRLNSSTSASYVNNFGTPSNFIDGEEVTTSNTIQAYNLISDSTKKILSTVGADSSAWETGTTESEITLLNYYQDGGSNDTLSGKFQEFLFFNSDVSNDRAAIENDMSSAFNSYSLAGSKGTQKLLNEYPGAAAAYSVRQLNANYSGPIMRVDNGYTELDIYPLPNGDLDTESIIQHAKVNSFNPNAKISVWYDQSGNGNDAAQAVNSNQPTICRNLSIVYENGKPAVEFDGSNNVLSSTYALNESSSSYEGFFILNADNDSSYNAVLQGGRTHAQISNTNKWTSNIGGANLQSSNTVTGAQFLGGYVWNNSTGNLQIFVDGTSVGQTTETADRTGTQMDIGGQGALAQYLGKMQEIILYASDQSTNRTDIEFNINKYFDISPQGPTKLLLDKHPGAAAAYSLRKLSAKYAGPAIKIRRASDSLEADVYFDKKGEVSFESIVVNVSETTTGKPQGNATFGLAVATLGEFVGNANYSSSGATDAFVVVWYDQSSKGNDAQQLTAANQPKIHDATTGMVVDENRKPAVEFDGANDLLQNLNIGTSQVSEATIYSVFHKISGEGGVVNWSGSNSLANTIRYTTSPAGYRFGWSSSSVGTDTGAQLLFTGQQDGANGIMNIDGTSQGTFTVDTNRYWDRIIYMGKPPWLSSPQMKMSEFVMYWSVNSASEITDIETNINNHYSIFTPELELGLINEFDGAAAAYSLRLLNYFYQGPLVRVRRDSDHVEVDVYPDENGVFSERSLVKNAVESSTGVSVGSPNDSKAFRFGEFAYGANCFVVEWKDQSSNSNHATQTTAGYQRKIYDATTGVVTYNGKPAMFKTGHTGGMYVHNIPAGTTWSSFATFKTNTTYGIGVHSRLPYVPFWYLAQAGSNNTAVSHFANTELYKNGNALTISTRGALASDIGTNQQTISAFGDLTENGSNNWHLWSAYGTSYYNLQGYVYEAIIYDSDQSDNRTNIETNINTFYNIF